MRAGRSRSKRYKPSAVSLIREFYEPLQGGTGMRRVPFYPLLITILVSLGSYLGCNPGDIPRQLEQQVIDKVNDGLQQRLPGLPVSTTRNPPLVPTQAIAMPQRTVSTLIIGSFNIQRLGPSKLPDQQLMQYYADIIRRFDVIALQEITSSDQNTLPFLLQYVNANGARYSYTISPQIGRTAKYLEQYAFVFDTTRVNSRQDACFVMRDEADLFHREPFVGRFATVANVQNPFTFSLVNIHTDPDEVPAELNSLAKVYAILTDYFAGGDYPEDDIVLLGDLNADPTRFQSLGQLPGVVPSIVGIPTNFTRTKTNDNILINRNTTREFTGRSGAMDFQTVYGLSQDESKRLSDHQPVWAEFYLQEAPAAQIATQPISYSRY